MLVSFGGRLVERVLGLRPAPCAVRAYDVDVLRGVFDVLCGVIPGRLVSVEPGIHSRRRLRLPWLNAGQGDERTILPHDQFGQVHAGTATYPSRRAVQTCSYCLHR